MIVEYIRFSVSAERSQDFLDAYEKAADELTQSPYCSSFDLSRSVEDGTQFILRIEWTSADDHMKGFRSSDVFKSFFALVRPFYNDILEMRHYERLIERKIR